MDKTTASHAVSPTTQTAHEWLDVIAHWLPAQLPIKDFIHHNTLHAFQHRPFEVAVEEAGAFFGAKSLESFEFYRQKFNDGKITIPALETVLKRTFSDKSEQQAWKSKLLNETFEEPPVPAGAAFHGLRSAWHEKYGLDLDSLTHPILFRLLSNFLDQGVALWEMPESDKGFFAAVMHLVQQSFLPLVPLSDKSLRPYRTMTPDQVIDLCLERIVLKSEDRPRYVLEMLLRHPGWSGMVYQVECSPGSLLERKSITLRQAVAIELLIELGWLYRKLGEGFTPLSLKHTLDWHPKQLASFTQEQRAKSLWHQAFEQSFYSEVFNSLYTNMLYSDGTVRDGGGQDKTPTVQAAFCIDDRECGIRRHLEEIWSEVETFGVAGFFGIDVMYQGVDDCYPAQHCPIVLKPKYLVRSKHSGTGPRKAKRLRHFHLDHGANTLFRGYLISQVLGFWSAVRLAFQVFSPTPSFATATSLSKVELDSELHLLRESDEVTPDGLLLGFNHAEMADRVAGLLKQIGCTKTFSELFVITAHGASSTNNPHFAAYDCGACSGKPGAPNARSFAMMANDPKVRVLVAERGVRIPDTTYFLGAMHDTTRDEIVWFDEHLVPARLRPLLANYRAKFKDALERNAKERCRRFLQLPADLTPAQAHQEVARRSAAIFEPRPELNHATNAMLVVGRRKWTRGLFMDRRSFLNSYDATQDPEGVILTNILSAAVIVCSGINLEYLFSRVDSEVYGAGTKLPHNVFGLIGVANGVQGDLRTGLPTQMTEAHDPIRLLTIVEQTPEVALKAAQRNPVVWEVIKNLWSFYACIDPVTKKISMFDGHKMVEVVFDPSNRVDSVQNSLAIVAKGSENLPLVRLKGAF